MRIHNPKWFGQCLMRARKKAGIPLMHLATKLDIHPKILGAIEKGIGGQEFDDDFLALLVENVPRFSLAIAYGVQPPPIPVRKLEGREESTPMPAAQMTPSAPVGPAVMPKVQPPRSVPTNEQLGAFVEHELKKDS